MKLASIILAAGKSSRMGQPKLVLPWGATTILGQIIQSWSQISTEQIVVVCASDDAAIASELDKLRVPREQRIINPQPELGMFSSIRCAARWNGWRESVTHFAIVLGDQPHLTSATLKNIVQFAMQYPEKICQPSRNGHGRHPVILPKAAFHALAETNASDLKTFLQSRSAEIALHELNDPALDLDLDTPADYVEALRKFPPAGN